MSKRNIIILSIVFVLLVALFIARYNKMRIPILTSALNSGFRYFNYNEFDSTAKFPEDSGKSTYNKDGKQKLTNSGKENMKKSFVKKLDDARHIVEEEWNKVKPASERIVFEIESGYRTQHFNDSLANSVSNSAHIQGHAADIVIGGYTTEQQKVILEALKRVGINRFGMARTTVHVDDDPSKNPNRVWYYFSDSIKIDPLKL